MNKPLFAVFSTMLIAGLIFSVLRVHRDEYRDATTSAKCDAAGDCNLDDPTKCTDKQTCGTWDKSISTCWKGVYDSTKKDCVKHSDVLPILGAVLSLLGFFGLIWVVFFSKSKK